MPGFGSKRATGKATLFPITAERNLNALHAVLCAAGYNIRWLLRAIVRLGLKGLFSRLIGLLAERGDGLRQSGKALPLACARAAWVAA